MSFGGNKQYYLVHLNFDNNEYNVFPYVKDRRFTARQAWNVINHTDPEYKDKMPFHATVDMYNSVIEKYQLNEKYCDRYCTFRCF